MTAVPTVPAPSLEPMNASGLRPVPAVMRNISDGLLLEIEVPHQRFRERQEAFRILTKDLSAFVGFENLDQRAESQGAEDVARRMAGLDIAGLHDLVACHTFRPRQSCIHAQRTTQQDD